MTDDDDLRDDFGDGLAAAMAERGDSIPAPETALNTVQRRARARRVRRGAATLTIAAAIAAVVVALVASGGSGKQVRVEESPTSTTIVTPGQRIVSYHGVYVEVPAGWPVVDGMHTALCGTPFGDTPTAYVGPNRNPPPSCPAPSPRYVVHHEGVWLLESPTPYPRARRESTASGVQVLETAEPLYSVRYVWFHGVEITIGVGEDPAVAQAIFDSIGFTDGAPDTPRSGICERSTAPDAMPQPERLAKRLVLEHGTVILDPPEPSDQPATSAEDVWRGGTGRPDYEHYRLILTRYTSAFPASPNGQGGYTPDHINLLAWVVYSTPITAIPGCGYYGVEAFDATTGQGLDTLTYGPGP